MAKYQSKFKKKDKVRNKKTDQILIVLWNVNEGNASQEHFPPRCGCRPVDDYNWDGRATFVNEEDLELFNG